MTNPQQRARARGKANEHALAADLNKRGLTTAKRVPLSGAMKDLPGDVDVPELDLLLEAKVYATVEIEGASYFRISLNWLWKVLDEAKRVGRRYAAVVIRGKNLRRRAVLIDYDEYIALLLKVSQIDHS